MAKVRDKWLKYPSLPLEKRAPAAPVIAASNADIFDVEALDTALPLTASRRSSTRPQRRSTP